MMTEDMDSTDKPESGNPLASPAPDPWWVSPVPPEPNETAAVPVSSPLDLWWVSSAPPQQDEPAEIPEVPASPGAGADGAPGERNEPEHVHVSPLPPTHTEPRKVHIPPRELPVDDDEDEEPVSLLGRLRMLDVASAAALLCGSVALLFVSIPEWDWLIKPLSGAGLLLGLLAGALPAVRKGDSVAPSLVVSVLCLLVLLFAGSWPTAPDPPPPMAAVPLQRKGMASHQPVDADNWVDAATNAVQKEDVRVQVVSARIGRVDLKNRSGVVPSSDRYLVIRLRVSYMGIVFQQTPYEPWADRADSPSKHPPILTDNTDRVYDQKVFDSGRKVVGRAEVDALTPGHQVKEVLIFPIPPGDVKYLRLKLPASAFGLTGEFRFQIPRGMTQAP
jgi:hypothetical protein